MSAVGTATYLCTSCPLGCRLEVDAADGDIVEIRGFECKRGERYAKQEHLDPRRQVSTTVRVTGGILPRLPVRVSEPVARDSVRAIVDALRTVRVVAPVRCGAVLVADVLGTGADVIAARSMRRAPRA